MTTRVCRQFGIDNVLVNDFASIYSCGRELGASPAIMTLLIEPIAR